MLGWEWLVQKAELFGTPLRWANYPTTATQVEIDAITSALRNMGTASWGRFRKAPTCKSCREPCPAYPAPTTRANASWASPSAPVTSCSWAQNLSVEHSGKGRSAATEVHREVELDLFETYAEYIVAVLNDQLIPQLITQNWGTADEVPYVEVEITRPERE